MASSVAGAWNYPLQLNNLETGVTNIVVNGVQNPLTSDIQSNQYGLTSTNGMSLVVGAPSFPATTLVTLAPGTEFNVMNDAGFFKTPLSVSYTDVDMRDASNVYAPTVLPADNSERIATTAYVNSVVAGSGGGNMLFSGTSAVGNHVVGTNIPGTNYGPSALNEDASTFNFSTKGLVADSLTSTTSLYLTAPIDLNVNATQVNTTCPVQVAPPGVANTKVSDTQVIVRNGSTPGAYNDMTINQIEITNGFDSSKLTNDKLYSNASNASTFSVVNVANDYASGSINVNTITSGGTLTLVAPGMDLQIPNVSIAQPILIETNDNLEIVSHAGFLNISTENGTLNIFTNGLSPQDVAINSTQDVLINSTGDITTTSTVNTTVNAVNIITNSTEVSMNTSGVFGITAQDNVTISSEGATTDITLTSSGNVINNTTDFNVNATNDVNLTATTNANLFANGLINNTSTDFNVTSTDVNINAVNVNVSATIADFIATPITTTSSTTANSFIKVGGTNLEVLLADGTTAPYNSGGSGGNYYQYRFDTSTTPTVVGRIQYNNANPTLTTIVWVNHLTDDSIDIDFYLAQIGLGDILYIQDKNLSTNFAKYIVTSSTQPVPNSYWAFGVTYATSEGTGTTGFANNHQIIFTSYVDSATINTRLNALEQKTIYQSTPTLNQTNFAGTVYADTLKIATGTASQYLMADGTTSALTTIGTSGVGTSLVKTGTSPSFVLNSLAVSTGLSSNLAGDTITLTNSSPASGISLASTGSGTSLLNSTTNPSFSTKSLAVGTGLSIASTTDTITLTNTVTGSTLANAGAGTSLVVSGTAPSLSVKSLSSGTGITLNDASNNIEIVNSSPASGITLSNAGTGTSILSSTSNPTFSTKSLTAGTNITFTSTANDITINSTGGGGSYTFTNGGTGTTLVSTSSTSTAFQPVSITAGANVSLTASGTDIVIASSGASGTNTISVVLESASASTFYPTFVGSGGTKTTINYDTGFSFVPSTNALTTSAYFASGKYTSSLALTSIAFEGLARTSQKVTTTDGSAFTSTYYPAFVPLSTSQNEQAVNTDSGLTYIPSQNRLATTNFDGVTFTSSTAIPGIGFVGASTSASQIQTTDGSAFTSNYFITFVPVSASANQQTVNTDSALAWNPSTNLLGLSATTNFTGILYTSSNVALTAGFVGTASRALELSQTNVDSATATYYPLLSTSSASSTSLNPSEAMAVDSGLSYVPSTNTLTATTFVGALTGTASKATNIVGTGTNQLVIQTATDTTSTSALANGASGTFLKSNGATSLPSWVASSTLGFQMSFGGRIVVANDYLTPNRFADASATGISTGSTYLTDWKCPVACSITAWSTAVQTTTVASLTINIAGVAGSAITGAGTSSTNTGTITARTVNAGDIIQVRMTAITGGTCVTLYFT